VTRTGTDAIDGGGAGMDGGGIGLSDALLSKAGEA
jgi:hypothetical protein